MHDPPRLEVGHDHFDVIADLIDVPVEPFRLSGSTPLRGFCMKVITLFPA